MKKLALLLSAFFTGSLLSASVVADPSAPASAPRTRTEPALACLLGFAPWGCQNVLFEARTSGAAMRNTTDCAREHVSQGADYRANEQAVGNTGLVSFGQNCVYGPLEAVDYLGSNAAGADVYVVQFKHADSTYIIPPPGPDGKTGEFWIRGGPLRGIVPSSLVRVTSPAVDKMTLYRRPWKS